MDVGVDEGETNCEKQLRKPRDPSWLSNNHLTFYRGMRMR